MVITDDGKEKHMSEIKGQLLGIILVLIVFGAISVSMAAVFRNTAKQVTDRSNGLGEAVETEMNKTEETPSDDNVDFGSGFLSY